MKIMQHVILLSLAIFMASHGKVAAKDCPEIYRRFSKSHSYCKNPNPRCPKIVKSSISSEDIYMIVKEHNNLRSRVATGKENLPTASNMLQMVWDDELAYIAQRHAEQCEFKHDCEDCRRVGSFAVGQNMLSSPRDFNVTFIDWTFSVRQWFNEIDDFQENHIDPFSSDSRVKNHHFTQIVWAETWRVGCGMIMMNQGFMYNALVVCNYGPKGNIANGSMYKKGNVCSACPLNSCCGKTCDTAYHYPGLCRIIDEKAPVYKPIKSYFFFCNFQNQSDCMYTSTGQQQWKIHNTLSGNFLEIILKGGENSTITFATNLKPKKESFCVVIQYRKNSRYNGEERANKAIGIFKMVYNGYEIKKALPYAYDDLHYDFYSHQMNIDLNMETEMKISFDVPSRKPDQFLEIKEIYAYDGKC